MDSSDPKHDFKPVLLFSEQEHRIFTRLGEGKLVKEIAATPGRKIAKSTVHKHLDRISEKLGWHGTSIDRLRALAGGYIVWCELTGNRRKERTRIELAKFEFRKAA